MREILFRGKRTDGKGWAKGCLSHNDETALIGEHSDMFWQRVDLATVGQYTGLKDKNGVRIFEGDKLQHPDGSVFIVVWSNSSSGWRARYPDGPYNDYSLGLQIGFKGLAVVIGNIHDEVQK
jgi:hypothetical protein